MCNKKIKADAVFIDNETYNHEFWQFAAKRKAKILYCFISLEEFDAADQNFLSDTPIYIDLNLENARGLDVAEKLFKRGFSKLYISSGHVDFDAKDYPYLSGVRGKEPPF